MGRRVVTIIPPRLREAHVAGFSAHLSTGQAHVLGVPLRLPALHADGTEIHCRYLVEAVAAAAGRSVYLAWIERWDGGRDGVSAEAATPSVNAPTALGRLS